MGCALGTWFLLALTAYTAVAAPNAPVKRQADVYSNEAIPELASINEALNSNPYKVSLTPGEDESNPRDKRLIAEAAIVKTGIKALLLNFIFGKIDGALDAKIRLINQLDKQNIVKNEKYFGFTTPKAIYSAGVRISATKGSFLTNILGSSSGSTGTSDSSSGSSSGSGDSSGSSGSGSILTSLLNLSSGSGGSGSSDGGSGGGSGGILSSILSLSSGSSGGGAGGSTSSSSSSFSR